MWEEKPWRWKWKIRGRIGNEYISGTVKVVEVSKKIQESRMRWYGHLRRRDGEEHVGREAMEMEVEGRRARGRPKTRWKDCIRNDPREKNIDEGTVHSRSEWRRLIHNGDPE